MILCLQLFMVAFVFVVAYAKCFLAHVSDRWLLSGTGFVLIAGIFLSERSILRSLQLVVAERQMPKPQWDFARDLRAAIPAGDGWKNLGGLVICLALFFGGWAALKPIALAISKIVPMPCACLNPSRPTPVAFPRC